MSTLSTIAAAAIDRDWATSRRWLGVHRPYEADDVIRLRGTVRMEHSLARRGAERLWHLLCGREGLCADPAASAEEALAAVGAGSDVLYLHGGPSRPVSPPLVGEVNGVLRRADQVDWAAAVTAGDHETGREWLVPVIATAESGATGGTQVFELMTAMIEAGAAAVLFADQLTDGREPGCEGGSSLIPAAQYIHALHAARLAADVAGVPTLIVASTAAPSAEHLGSDSDSSEEALARGLAYAAHADVLWLEAGRPDREAARAFAERVHAEHPEKLLAYCSSQPPEAVGPHESAATAAFTRELSALGYVLQVARGCDRGLAPLFEETFRSELEGTLAAGLLASL